MITMPQSAIQRFVALRARGNSGAAAVADGLHTLWRDRSGGTLIWFALTMPMVLGMAGIGVDATLWFMDRRIMQTASDSGAIAGAHALAQGGTEAEARKVVETEIARNDFAKAASERAFGPP